MATIENFECVRADGKIIEEWMKAEDMFALGAIEKVVEIRWRSHDRSVSMPFPHGVLANVVDGRQFVVINESDGRGRHSLWVLNPDGSRRFQVSDTQLIRAQVEVGAYRWFEKPRKDGPNLFGVIFERDRDNGMFQLDINAEHGSVEAVYATR